MGMTNTPATLLEAVRFFKKPENCHIFMVSRRWPNGDRLPSVRVGVRVLHGVRQTAGSARGNTRKRTFTLKTGTIFEDSAIGLDKWLPCVWLIANAKNGISSHEIKRALGVTQKTAWFMLQRIRLAMQDENDGGKLGGDVGSRRDLHRRQGAQHALQQSAAC